MSPLICYSSTHSMIYTVEKQTTSNREGYLSICYHFYPCRGLLELSSYDTSLGCVKKYHPPCRSPSSKACRLVAPEDFLHIRSIGEDLRSLGLQTIRLCTTLGIKSRSKIFWRKWVLLNLLLVDRQHPSRSHKCQRVESKFYPTVQQQLAVILLQDKT